MTNENHEKDGEVLDHTNTETDTKQERIKTDKTRNRYR